MRSRPAASSPTSRRPSRALEKSKHLERKAAEAADRAAAARKSYQAAKGELGTALGKAYSIPGPLADPEIYRAVVKMAIAKIREGGHSLAAFVADIRAARISAKLGELPPEELAKVKQAWSDADVIVQSAKAPVEITSEAGKVIGTYQHGSQLEIVSNKVKLHGGNKIKLDPDATTTITGVLDDTNAVARRGERLPGATVMGENTGGLNILRSPKWDEIQAKYKPLLDTGDTIAYWKSVTDEFWETVNKPWLDDAIARGDHFRIISNPADEKALFVTTGRDKQFVLDNGNRIQSIFGREVAYLKSKRYVFNPDGTVVKVK